MKVGAPVLVDCDFPGIWNSLLGIDTKYVESAFNV
jgi:hypothetical protein